VTLLQTFKHSTLATANNKCILIHVPVGIISLVMVLICLHIRVSLLTLLTHFAVMGLHV